MATIHLRVMIYIYTFLQTLIWVFFKLKCAKLSTFCILHIFATADVVALPNSFIIVERYPMRIKWPHTKAKPCFSWALRFMKMLESCYWSKKNKPLSLIKFIKTEIVVFDLFIEPIAKVVGYTSNSSLLTQINKCHIS